MIIPQLNQTILNFSVNRFLVNTNPSYQIDTLINNILNTNLKFVSSEISQISNISNTDLFDFGRHMMSNLGYIMYNGLSSGYSQPKIMGYLSETHAASLSSDELSIIKNQIKSYVNTIDFAVYNGNEIYSCIYPHLYIISKYNNITIQNISNILATATLEEIIPSDTSMINMLYTNEILDDISSSILNLNSFNDGISNIPFSNYLYVGMLNLQISSLATDISNFINSDSLFYDNLTSKIISISGTIQSSAGYKSNLKNTIYSVLSSYLTDANSSSSFITTVNIESDIIIVSGINMYRELVQVELSHFILRILESTGYINSSNPDEAVMIRAIYAKYIDLFSDLIVHIESECSRISTTSLDLINSHIHLYSGLFKSLAMEIKNVFGAFVNLPSSIPSPFSDAEMIAQINNAILIFSFSTSDPNMLKLLNASFATSLTSSFETYMRTQETNSVFMSSVIQPILNASLSSSNVNSKLSNGDLSSSIVSSITSEFNTSCWLRLDSVLSTLHPQIVASSDITSPVVIPDMAPILKSAYSKSQVQGYRSDTISQVVSISIFNTMMNSSLDIFNVSR